MKTKEKETKQLELIMKTTDKNQKIQEFKMRIQEFKMRKIDKKHLMILKN